MANSIDFEFMRIGETLARFGTEMTSRNGMVQDITGYVGEVDPRFAWLTNNRRALDPSYACAEILWYLSGSGNTNMIRAYAPQYRKFENGGIAYGAYGPRVIDQLHQVVRILRDSPDSRQAVVAVWDKGDLGKVRNDLPCTLSMQFLVRNGALNQIVTMRSNDLWLGYPYDVFAFTTIGRLVANELVMPLRRYLHQAGSMHLYERHWAAGHEAFHERSAELMPFPVWSEEIDTRDNLETITRVAVAFEERYRFKSGDISPSIADQDWNELGPIGKDLVACAIARWDSDIAQAVNSPTLRKALALYADHRRNRLAGKDNTGTEANEAS